MTASHVISVDLARVYSSTARKTLLTTLAWGDEVEVIDVTGRYVEIRATQPVEQSDGSIHQEPVSGFIAPSQNSGIAPQDVVTETKNSAVLKVDFVDVQQGDATIIETPLGRTILIDGGENQLFARYLASRFKGTRSTAPKQIDCILVTHGDADHFVGLIEIQQSEYHSNEHKRLFLRPLRVYHNGLVKRPTSVNGIRLKAT
jgi:hypothetical protein